MFTIVIAHVPFSLISYSFDTAEVMLILILIDVHYSQEAAFCFEKVEMVKITPPQILSELSVKKSLQQIFWFPIGAELPPHLTAIWKILSSKITYGRSSSCVPHSAYAILIFDCFSMNTKLELYCYVLVMWCTRAFQSESTLYSCLNENSLLKTGAKSEV